MTGGFLAGVLMASGVSSLLFGVSVLVFWVWRVRELHQIRSELEHQELRLSAWHRALVQAKHDPPEGLTELEGYMGTVARWRVQIEERLR